MRRAAWIEFSDTTGWVLSSGLMVSQALLGRILQPTYSGIWGANLSLFLLVGAWLAYLIWGARHAGAYSGAAGEAPSRRSHRA